MSAPQGLSLLMLVVSILLLSAVSGFSGRPPAGFTGSSDHLARPAAVAPPSNPSTLALPSAPGAWTPAFGVPAAAYGPIVYDEAAARFITFGVSSSGNELNETWSYDLATNLWANLTPVSSPPARSSFGLVYDSRADLVVLFGGRSNFGGIYGDTWTYNVTSNRWAWMNPATTWPALADVGMAYDPVADRVIVFGGSNLGPQGDTWALDLDNATWTNLNPSNAPAPRNLPMMTYDATTDRIILFGGASQGGVVNDTWTYAFATNTWTDVTTTKAPSARAEGTLSYDSRSQRSILFGGWSFAGAHDDTWTYDAVDNTWTNATKGVAPPANLGGTAFDPLENETLLLLTGSTLPPYETTWTFDFATSLWTSMSMPGSGLPRSFLAMAYDSRAGLSVVFGGLMNATRGVTVNNQTWTFNLTTFAWTNRTTAGAPSPRTNASMAYDAAADRVVLFGGTSKPGVYLSDTWAFDLATDTWTNVTTSAPSPRASAGFAYDSRADRFVLFGGANPTGFLRDTWAYDFGTRTWTNVTPATSPPQRLSPGFAYDPAANRTVMFGGYKWGGALNDTWSFDLGTRTWTQRFPTISPLGRAFTGMAYDASKDRFVLFAGYGNLAPTTDSWAYDYGADTWTNLNPALEPPPRWNFGMDYDAANARTLVVGGFTGAWNLGDAWSYAFPDAPSAPRGVKATAGEGNVTLAWSVPSSDGGAPVTGYFVYRGTASGTEAALASLANLTTYVDANVVAGTPYYYEVAAVNLAGGGLRSSEVNATPVPIPDTTPPTITITSPASGTNLAASAITVRGTASDNVAVVSVEIRVDGSAWMQANGTTSWYGNVTLLVGYNVIDARVTDPSGNQNMTSVGVLVPSVVLVAPPGWLWPAMAGAVLLAVVGTALVTWLILRRRTNARERTPSASEPPKP